MKYYEFYFLVWKSPPHKEDIERQYYNQQVILQKKIIIEYEDISHANKVDFKN